MYKNLIEPSIYYGSVFKITETYGTNNSDFGTSKLSDGNLQSYWSTDRIANSSILFDMGSAVYVDTLISVHNLNETGTHYIKAGDTNPPNTVTYGMPILGSTGTSINFITSPVNYRYWQCFADGTRLSEVTKFREIFIGKRDTFSINPEYPFGHELDSSTIVTESEKGQKKVYHKYTKNKWNFKYSAIGNALNGTFLKIRNFTSGNYKPFWMCLDFDDNKFETYMVRFIKNSYKHQETAYNIHDVQFSVEQEL